GWTHRRTEAAPAVRLVEAVERAGTALVGTILQAPRLEDDLLRPLLLGAARDRGVAGRDLAHALVDLLPLERGRRDLLGDPRRPGRVLRRPRRRGRDRPLRPARRRGPGRPAGPRPRRAAP